VGRTDKAIDRDAPAYELATFMRQLRQSSGMALRTISRSGHVAHSTLSQNSDGRLREWHCVEECFAALYTAAEKNERTMPVPLDAARNEARALWTIAQARGRQGSSWRNTRAGAKGALVMRNNPPSSPAEKRSPARSPADRFLRDSTNRRDVSLRPAPRQLPGPAVPPMQAAPTDGTALRTLMDKVIGCPRCAPLVRQAALDDPAIQAVLAGTAPATS
jgi:hypothetical protein